MDGWSNYGSLLEISFAINISWNLAPHWWEKYKKETDRIQEKLVFGKTAAKTIATSLNDFPKSNTTAGQLRDEACSLEGVYDHLLTNNSSSNKRHWFKRGPGKLADGFLLCKTHLCAFSAAITIFLLVLGSIGTYPKCFQFFPIQSTLIVLLLISPNFIGLWIQHGRYKKKYNKWVEGKGDVETKMENIQKRYADLIRKPPALPQSYDPFR